MEPSLRILVAAVYLFTLMTGILALGWGIVAAARGRGGMAGHPALWVGVLAIMVSAMWQRLWSDDPNAAARIFGGDG